MANEQLKQNAAELDRHSKNFGAALNKLDVSTVKFRSKRGSIVKAAQGNVFEFPVFISDSVPLDYAEATSALLEQVYASYLQMAISINPVISATKALNGLQFSGLRTDTNKYLEYTDTMWQHDACHAVYTTEDVTVEFNMISYNDTEGKMILEQVDHQPLEEFEHYITESKWNFDKNGKGGKGKNNNGQASSIQMDELHFGDDTNERYARQAGEDAKADKGAAKQLKDAEDDLKAKTKEHKEAADKFNKSHDRLEATTQRLEKTEKKYDDLMEKLKGATDKEKENLRKEIELTRKEREQLKKDIAEQKKKSDWADMDRANNQGDLANRARVKSPKVLSEKDLEKLNTMKPILMTVDLNITSEDGKVSPIEYVVGVKTYNRMIDSDIIPEVAQYPIKEMDKISRKAKWRAGELKFFSDIVFRIKEKKQTAIDSKDPKRKWYRRLYELAHMKGDAQTVNIVNGKSVIASFLMDKMGKTKSVHGLVPNVAMVVSKTDVDICKRETGIDLLRGKTAAKMCNELFMMAFIVIDVEAESIKLLLPEIHNEFDVHSISSVNRQIAAFDSSNKTLKNMFGLLNRG